MLTVEHYVGMHITDLQFQLKLMGSVLICLGFEGGYFIMLSTIINSVYSSWVQLK